MRSVVLQGLAAGAAGTTALNAVTYLDMAVRARPASTTPEQTVRVTEKLTGISLSGEGSDSATAENRRSGIGALLGIATGLAAGASYGLARTRMRRTRSLPVLAALAGLGANVGSVVPIAALGVSDPRGWSLSSWLEDLVPHLVYGVVTAAVFEELRRRPAWWRFRG